MKKLIPILFVVFAFHLSPLPSAAKNNNAPQDLEQISKGILNGYGTATVQNEPNSYCYLAAVPKKGTATTQTVNEPLKYNKKKEQLDKSWPDIDSYTKLNNYINFPMGYINIQSWKKKNWKNILKELENSGFTWKEDKIDSKYHFFTTDFPQLKLAGEKLGYVRIDISKEKLTHISWSYVVFFKTFKEAKDFCVYLRQAVENSCKLSLDCKEDINESLRYLVTAPYEGNNDNYLQVSCSKHSADDPSRAFCVSISSSVFLD